MATSRRRERELARRRYERRRQAEVERRAQAKRRNTIVGAVSGTAVVIAVLLILTFTVFTGGSGKAKVKAGSTPKTSTSPSTSATPAPPAPTKCAAISPNPPSKGEPFIPPVKGKPSSKLVSKDIKVGHGAAAKSGSNITVKYVGISCDTGKVFDASYTDGAKNQELPAFPLGQGQVIPGWDQGLVGMKTGGVRELVIPASLAYKAAGSGSTIQGNDTLIFVVTMEKIA